MATANFNSMPQNITYGIRDLSVPDPIITPKQYPTHLPLWFIFAKKGPAGRILADGAAREQLYGSDTFNPTSKFFTHQTHYSNVVTSEGNQSIYQRLIPPGAQRAGVRIWVDILPEQIPDYNRLADGNYQLDSLGNPVPSGTTVSGVTVKFVKQAITEAQLGTGAVMAGDQVDGGGNSSQRYPLMDILASHEGEYGNDLGIRIWAPIANSRTEPDTELIEENQCYPFQFECLDKSGTVIQYIRNLSGSSAVTCVFKEDQVKRSVAQRVSFDERFLDSYNDLERPNMAPLYGPFGNALLYKNNLDAILTQFYNLEQPFATYPGTDFNDTGLDEKHRFNFISGKSSKGVPYYSFRINRTDANAEPMSDVSAIWLEGGNDGTVDLTTLSGMVKQEIERYGDINQEVTEDRLANPESIFYDSGFDIETKLALANFIAVRKDTFLVWCLQDAQGTKLDGSQESSLSIALYTRGRMMPESSEYGTPAARFMIVACDGKLIASQNKNRMPLSLEIAAKSASYMGAGNGIWNSSRNFSHGRLAEVSMFRDVNVTWRPIAARRRDWYNGMVYVQKKDMDTLFFPALRTGYSIDNSILTNYFTVMVFVDLQKTADRLWSEYTGSSEYTNEQFQKYLVRDFNEMIEGKYDKRVIIVPRVIFTAIDEYNGYSWTLSVDVGADVMKTVQYTLLTGYRRESMPTSA